MKLHMQSSDKAGKTVYIFGPGHMTKMVAMPIYCKNNLILQNNWTNCFKTWYVAFRRLVLHSK